MRSYFDWLSDEIVMDIIGRLNWKDAAKTCVVSHRFRNVFGYVCDQKLLFEKTLSLEDETNVNFVDFVNHVLQSHKRSKVDSLKIALVGHYNIYSNELVEDDYETLPQRIITPGYEGYNHFLEYTRDLLKKRKIYAKAKDDFDGWIRFAKAKGVESLELTRHGLDNAEATSFYPAFPMLDMWDKLTTLTLKSVLPADLYHGLDKGRLKNLESLVLEDALPGPLFAEDGDPLKAVTIRSPTLKRLEIRQCRLRWITIDSTPNLEYFKYVPLDGAEPVDYHVNFNFSEVPKLSHIYFTGGYFTDSCMLRLQQQAAGVLEELELLVDSTTYTSKDFLTLQLLGHLKLNFQTINERCIPLLVFKDMLATCPKLQKLTLDYHKWDEDMYSFSDLMRIFATSHDTHDQHYYLKEVEFIGWCGNKNEDDVVSFLKKIAPNLEKTLFHKTDERGRFI